MEPYGHNPPLSTAHGRSLTRREVLRAGWRAAAGAALLGVLGPSRLWAQETRGAVGGQISRVIDVHSDAVIYGVVIRQRILREIVDSAVTTLAETRSLEEAWGQYVRPGERILVKFTRQEGPAVLRTCEPILRALVESLESAGHDRANIIAADCPFARLVEGLGETPIGWGEHTVDVLGQREQLRRYLDGVDAIINVPLVCDDSLVGVGGAMLNMSLPLIRRPGLYLDRVHEAIVDIAAAPEIADRVRLTLVNALRVVYDGGPQIASAQKGYMHGLWAATDMVAADRVMHHRISQLRREHGLTSLEQQNRPPRYLTLANQRQMGNSDLRWIDRQSVRI